MSNEILDQVKVLYEDTDCAVIYKPAGLMVHADGRSEGPFLTDWVLKKYPEAAMVGETILTPDGTVIQRPGIVHRLDRETSGALLIARTSAGHESLKQQFKDRTIQKKYLAFVWGELTEEFGTINRPIGRSGKDFRRWSAQRGMRGEMRDAETYWTRIGTGSVEIPASNNPSGMEKFTLLEAQPKTGRTHQIRVHFLAIQHPVVSDPLYAAGKPKALGFERTALHANSIEFADLKGKQVKVIAPVPQDFLEAAKILNIKL